MVKFCSKCKKILPIEAAFCPTCGNQNLLQFCQNCKKIVPNSMKSCPTCAGAGTLQRPAGEGGASKAKKKTGKFPLLLAIVLLAGAGAAIWWSFFSPEPKVTIVGLGTELEEGETASIEYEISPEWAILRGVKWESTDNTVAAVNQKGEVTAVGEGSCTVYLIVSGIHYSHYIIVESNDGGSGGIDGDAHDSDYTYSGGSTYIQGGSKDISDDYKLALFTLAQEEVKNRLKSPSSAKFPINYLGDEVQYERNGDRYTIASWVEAENSFGATLRQQFMLSTTISGGKMKDIICIIG